MPETLLRSHENISSSHFFCSSSNIIALEGDPIVGADALAIITDPLPAVAPPDVSLLLPTACSTAAAMSNSGLGIIILI